jgi:hypothetical protein
MIEFRSDVSCIVFVNPMLQANRMVSGDHDLLDLREYQDIPIFTTAVAF